MTSNPAQAPPSPSTACSSDGHSPTVSAAASAPPPRPTIPTQDGAASDLTANTTRHGSPCAADYPTDDVRQLLHDKDTRILALEHELGSLEAEFGRELDKLSHNEIEAATFWQSRHSELNQKFLGTDTELRLLRAKLDQWATERDELMQGWEAARRDLAARECEVADLRGQVRGLKGWLANSTRLAHGSDVPADDVLADAFSRLANGLQNWVISNFRRAKLDLSRAEAATLKELARFVPAYEDLAKDAKLQLLQSLVSSILVATVFDCYFFGLTTSQADQCSQMESSLQLLVDESELVNQWRASTLAMLSKNPSSTMHEETSRQTEAVTRQIIRLLEAVTVSLPPTTAPGATSRGPSPAPPDPVARATSLHQLVITAVELARQLSTQPALFRVFMPSSGPQPESFDPEYMEDVGGLLDEEALAAGPAVRCAMFPGVVKRGDEKGGNLQQYKNTIAKARVMCCDPTN